jgi:hypothetical protein
MITLTEHDFEDGRIFLTFESEYPGLSYSSLFV